MRARTAASCVADHSQTTASRYVAIFACSASRRPTARRISASGWSWSIAQPRKAKTMPSTTGAILVLISEDLAALKGRFRSWVGGLRVCWSALVCYAVFIFYQCGDTMQYATALFDALPASWRPPGAPTGRYLASAGAIANGANGYGMALWDIERPSPLARVIFRSIRLSGTNSEFALSADGSTWARGACSDQIIWDGAAGRGDVRRSNLSRNGSSPAGRSPLGGHGGVTTCAPSYWRCLHLIFCVCYHSAPE